MLNFICVISFFTISREIEAAGNLIKHKIINALRLHILRVIYNDTCVLIAPE